MASTTHIHGEFYPVEIENRGDEPAVIWIRADGDTISLDLTSQQRHALREALDKADAAEVVS